ncbi:MAG: Hsp33 family molecular chaperone HslO [Cyanobacteria bacterium J06648_16]
MADQLIRATAADGSIRVVGAITTELVEDARTRHSLSYVATAALGRATTAGLLLASSMKQAQARVNLRIKGSGPLGGILIDAGLNGTVRGYVDNPQVDIPLNLHGKLDVGGAIGKDGYLHVTRDLGYGQPYSSTVELVTGEIGDDVTQYLATSEQTPSALALGVLVNTDGVEAAGGLLLQVLPKTAIDEALVTKLESRLSTLTGFTPLLQAGKTLPEIFADLVGDMGLHIFPESQPLRFDCPCTQRRMLGALKMLGEAELQDMIQTDGGAEATCHFCNTVYHTDSQGLERIIQEMRLEKATR